jgi:hypothetical protein
VFWPGENAMVELADMSSGGCSIIGDKVPSAGTKVFVSLTIGGLPNVRLPAVAVRSPQGNGAGSVAAVRFELPRTSAGGLEKLLAQYTSSSAQRTPFQALLIDSQVRTRDRIAAAVRAAGAEVIAVGTAHEALLRLREYPISVVLARGDLEGLSALGALSRVSPSTFRVVFGRGSARDEALRLGLAQASADDPCSAKCLGALLERHMRPD